MTPLFWFPFPENPIPSDLVGAISVIETRCFGDNVPTAVCRVLCKVRGFEMIQLDFYLA